jgi:hypothetical protein
MAMLTYVDVIGTVKDWINSRPNLTGLGKPLQKGAHLKDLVGAASSSYARLSLIPSGYPMLGVENPTMVSRVSALIYGPTLEAVTIASLALADEVCHGLVGKPQIVGAAQIWAADDITGPSDLPESDTIPRHLLDFTVVVAPYP